MRELFKALSELEANLIEQHGVSLNEAMALCCIGGDRLTASAISEHTGLSASHTSKVIRSIEDKELIVRSLGDKDKRQMYFTLSDNQPRNGMVIKPRIELIINASVGIALLNNNVCTK